MWLEEVSKWTTWCAGLGWRRVVGRWGAGEAAGEATGVTSEWSSGQVEKQTLPVGGGCEHPWARDVAGGLPEGVGAATGSSRPRLNWHQSKEGAGVVARGP